MDLPAAAAGGERIGITQGGLLLYPHAFADDAALLFDALFRETCWEQHNVLLFGRRVPAPRLSAWHGGSGCRYRYSGTVHEPRPIGPALERVRARVQQWCNAEFNAVLLNLYRDGRDSMAWHSDDEPELGAAPLVASLSLGATRRFLLRTRSEPRRRIALELNPGSLLLMEPPLQEHWQHALPKTRRACGPRLNLTFRWVLPSGCALY
jgi:alkylated DNA repair dioxygenase AlkB